jgi:hypothetical protein
MRPMVWCETLRLRGQRGFKAADFFGLHGNPGIDRRAIKILLDFGVPLLDENDRPIGAVTATKSP